MISKRAKERGIFGGLILLIAAISSSAAQDRLFVEIDAFSGRPNPRFALEASFLSGADTVSSKSVAGDSSAAGVAAEADRAATQSVRGLCARKGAAIGAAYPERSGYRGVRILRQVGQDSYTPVAELHGGGIRVPAAKAVSLCGDGGNREDAYYADGGAALEKSLLQLAVKKGVMSENVRKRILEQMGKR